MLQPLQMKNLLKYYKIIPAKIEMLDMAIRLCGNDADISGKIYNESMRQTISDMPFPPAGNVSDKVLNIVQNYEHELQRESAEHTIAKETLEYIVKQIDLALGTLSPLEASLVRGHCINGLTYEVIAEKLPETATYSIASLCNFMGNGVSRMCKMVTFGHREYGIAMRALNDETTEQKKESDDMYDNSNMGNT